MWFARNQKRIRLSRKLNWSVGKSQHTGFYFWTIGSLCLAAAVVIIVRTNSGLQNGAKPEVLGAATETAQTKPSFTDYTVNRGETLFTISQKFGVPTETLAQLNDIRPPFTVKAGEIIKVPAQ